MRTITRIILHCSASIEGVNLSANDIRSYHCNPIRMGGRGWRNPGYHYVIRLDGTVEELLPIQYVANGVKGYNQESIHICYVGGLKRINNEHQRINNEQLTINNGHPAKTVTANTMTAKTVPANTMTARQRAAIATLLTRLHSQFPQAKLYGHNQLAAKACPCFKVAEAFPEAAAWCAEK